MGIFKNIFDNINKHNISALQKNIVLFVENLLYSIKNDITCKKSMNDTKNKLLHFIFETSSNLSLYS
jgi:hypothetical protein